MEPHYIEYCQQQQQQLQLQHQLQSVCYCNSCQPGIDINMNSNFVLGSSFQPDHSMVYHDQQQQNNYYTIQNSNNNNYLQQQQTMNQPFFNSFGSTCTVHDTTTATSPPIYFQQEFQQYNSEQYQMNMNNEDNNKLIYTPPSPLPSIQSNLSSPNLMDDQFSSTMSVASFSSSVDITTSATDSYFTMMVQSTDHHHHHHHSLIEPLTPPYSPPNQLSFSIGNNNKPLITTKIIMNEKRKLKIRKSMKQQKIHGAPFQLRNDNDNDGATFNRQQQQQQQSKEQFICQHKGCGKVFGRKYNLTSHQQSHSSERPFGCVHCSKRFARHHDLRRHILIHTGETPHQCKYCKRGFSRSDALTRHYTKFEECELKLSQDLTNPINLRRLKKAKPTGYGEKKIIK